MALERHHHDITQLIDEYSRSAGDQPSAVPMSQAGAAAAATSMADSHLSGSKPARAKKSSSQRKQRSAVDAEEDGLLRHAIEAGLVDSLLGKKN